MKNKLQGLMRDITSAYDYFLHHPDKTYVILHVYFLNPLFTTQEKILFWVVDKTRECLKRSE